MLNLTLRDSDSDAFALRTLALGTKPLLLIEPRVIETDAGEDELEFDIDCTDLSLEALIELLEFLVDTLRAGTVSEVTE